MHEIHKVAKNALTFRIEGIKIFWEHGDWNDLMLTCWSQEKFHREGDIESEVIPESFQAKGDVVGEGEQCLHSVFLGIFGFTTFQFSLALIPLNFSLHTHDLLSFLLHSFKLQRGRTKTFPGFKPGELYTLAQVPVNIL